jgi:hypothetical protein
MIPSDPLFHKPKAIIAAKNILFATIFLGFIDWIVDRLNRGLPYRPNVNGMIITLLTMIVIFVLAKQIGLGRIWARTVYLILFVVSIVSFALVIIPIFKSNLLLGVLLLLEAILQILALKFLFSQESTNWFRRVQSADLEHTK